MPRIFPHQLAGAPSAAASLAGPYRPLVPELYSLLQQRLGSVKVACPGEAFVANWVRDPTTSRLRPVFGSPGEYYRTNCPFCNDTRHRLWINHMYAQFDADGRRLTYLAHCYRCVDFGRHRRQLEELVLGFQNRDARRSFVVHPGSTEPVGLFQARPPGVLIPLLDLPPDHKARQYMEQVRKYSPDLIAKYRLAYCVQADSQYFMAGDRIIFPIYFENMLVGWQARYIGDIDFSARSIPKFYSMPGFHKRLVLYNYDTARHKPFLVVVEGMSDAHAVGDHAVSLFGKSMSQRQRLLLLQLPEGTPFLLLLDPEACEESEALLHDLATAPGRHPVVNIVLPGGLDPGKFIQDRATLWNIIQSQARTRGLDLRFT